MLTRFSLVAVFALLIASRSCLSPSVVLYAQTLPSVRTVSWNPSPGTENVTGYILALDAGPTVTVLATACSLTACSGTISVPIFGPHVWTVMSTNANLTGGPGVIGTGQTSGVASQPFSLNPAPSAVTGQTIK